MNEKIRKALHDMGHDDAGLFSRTLDDAIVGVTSDGQVIYDHDKMVQIMMTHDWMTEDAAIEAVQYVRHATRFDRHRAPIVMHPIQSE